MVAVVVPLRYFSKADGATRRIGRRLGARLHEVGRIVDHRRQVALIGAAEIVVVLVLEVALVLDRRAEVVGPQPAGTGDRRDLRIVQPDRRQCAGLPGDSGGHGPARRHAGGGEASPGSRAGISAPPRVGRIDRHIDADGAGAFAQPALRHSHHVGAREEVMGMAQTWLREGTGGINIDMPVETPTGGERTAREIQVTFASAGVPPRAVNVRQYRPQDPRFMAAIRLTYPRISATAGPCGLWPDDLGPSINNKGYFDNKSYYNFGCSNQRNLAAMVDNPADLVQPRTETPAYQMRRDVAFEKYRKGTPPRPLIPRPTRPNLATQANDQLRAPEFRRAA